MNRIGTWKENIIIIIVPGLQEDRLHIALLPTSNTNPARTSFMGSILSSVTLLLTLIAITTWLCLYETK